MATLGAIGLGCVALLLAGGAVSASAPGHSHLSVGGGSDPTQPPAPHSGAHDPGTGHDVLGPAVPPRVRAVTRDTSDHPFTPETDNQGWWASRQNNEDLNDNYFVGVGPTEGSLGSLRNFFSFDLSGIKHQVAFAQLVLTSGSYRGQASETLGLFHVRTNAARLNHNVGINRNIFRDLGHGQSYGRFRVPSHTHGSVIRLSLDHAAVVAINRARGRWFSIGGSLLSLSNSRSDDEWLFGSTSGQGVQRLVLFHREPTD